MMTTEKTQTQGVQTLRTERRVDGNFLDHIIALSQAFVVDFMD